MKTLYEIIGAVPIPLLQRDEGINYMVDFVAVDGNGRRITYTKGYVDNNRNPQQLMFDPSFIYFTSKRRPLTFNPNNQTLFQDPQGEFFINRVDVRIRKRSRRRYLSAA